MPNMQELLEMFTSVLAANGCIYRYRFKSESEIKCLDRIGIADIDIKLISDFSTLQFLLISLCMFSGWCVFFYFLISIQLRSIIRTCSNHSKPHAVCLSSSDRTLCLLVRCCVRVLVREKQQRENTVWRAPPLVMSIFFLFSVQQKQKLSCK